MNQETVYKYLIDKLEAGAQLSKIVRDKIGIELIKGWQVFSYRTNVNPNITNRVGTQLTSILLEETREQENWIIVLENSTARCNDAWLVNQPPPQNSHFCYSEGALTERVYFYILPEFISDTELPARIIGYSLNAWQNIGFIIVKEKGEFWVKKIFCDYNDLDSVIFIEVNQLSLGDDVFSRKIQILLKSV